MIKLKVVILIAIGIGLFSVIFAKLIGFAGDPMMIVIGASIAAAVVSVLTLKRMKGNDLP